MPANLYADIDTFERRMIDGQRLDETDRIEVERVLASASRQVDLVRGPPDIGHFYAETRTITPTPNGSSHMFIPDLLTAASIKFDTNGDRAFDATLAATDYRLIRFGHPDEYGATPKTMLVLDAINGDYGSFPSYSASIQIVGQWGYTNDVERLAPTGTLEDAADTSLVLSVEANLAVGQTLLLDAASAAEQVYITGGNGLTWTCDRGMNGSTAAAQAAVTVDRYVYPDLIMGAALILAFRRWKRRETGYSNVIANPVVGSYETFKRTDPDVLESLAPFVRGDYLI